MTPGVLPPLQRPPLTSPPNWAAETDGPAAEGTPGGPLPGEGWPDLKTVEYLTKVIVLGLLLLAIPYLLSVFVRSPREASHRAASAAFAAK